MIFDISEKVAVVTGASGILGGSIAESLMHQGASVVVLGRSEEGVNERVEKLKRIHDNVMGAVCDVLNMKELTRVRNLVIERWSRIDILINCAGGNTIGGRVNGDQQIFDISVGNWEEVVDLNMNGTVYPSLIFGKAMADQKSGSIINISSMAAYSAITGVPGYSAAKAAVNSFTQWLAMEMAMKFSDKIRVNAIAPGFFIGNQNRDVLINPDGSLTERGEKVIAKTPMGRFGDITELNGIVQFLCSDAASFITGAIIPVDGGFSAFSGV